jgi:hypothetical protein
MLIPCREHVNIRCCIAEEVFNLWPVLLLMLKPIVSTYLL